MREDFASHAINNFPTARVQWCEGVAAEGCGGGERTVHENDWIGGKTTEGARSHNTHCAQYKGNKRRSTLPVI